MSVETAIKNRGSSCEHSLIGGVVKNVVQVAMLEYGLEASVLGCPADPFRCVYSLYTSNELLDLYCFRVVQVVNEAAAVARAIVPVRRGFDLLN